MAPAPSARNSGKRVEQSRSGSAGGRRAPRTGLFVALAVVVGATVLAPAASARHTERVYAGNWVTSYEDTDPPTAGTISIRWVEEQEGKAAIEAIGGAPPDGDILGGPDLSCFNRAGSDYYVGSWARAGGRDGVHAGCVDQGRLESRYREDGETRYGEFTIRAAGGTWDGFFSHPFESSQNPWSATFDDHFNGDNAGDAPEQRFCAGKPATIDAQRLPRDRQRRIVGTNRDDVIMGSRYSTEILGGGGDDVICDGGGYGLLIDAGPGNDIVLVTDGPNFVEGGPDDDVIVGGRHADTLYGNGENDVIMGGGGADTLRGGKGDDLLADFAIVVTGVELPLPQGAEFDGSDKLYGGPGDDRLVETAGNDKLWGGPDQDTFFSSELGDDKFFGGSSRIDDETDFDGIVYRFAEGPVTVNLQKGLATFPSGTGNGHDRLTGINGIQGSPAGDKLIGHRDAPNVILGGDGNDTIMGGRRRDRLIGEKGHDRLFGSRGRDFLFGSQGRDRLHGGPGRDEGHGGPGPDTCKSVERAKSCRTSG